MELISVSWHRTISVKQRKSGGFARLACAQKNLPAGAEPKNLTLTAIRLARETPSASVPNEPMTPVRPMLARDQFHQVLLNFLRVFLFG